MAKLTVHENIKQKIYVLETSEEKPKMLEKILQKVLGNNKKMEKEKIIIFFRRKHSCDEMARLYSQKGYGSVCESLHGDKHHRSFGIIAKFAASDVRVLFTTDVVARGIDIGDITMVINYDFNDGNFIDPTQGK